MCPHNYGSSLVIFCFHLLVQYFQPFFHGGAPVIIVLMTRNPCPGKLYRPGKYDSQEPFCYHWSGSSV